MGAVSLFLFIAAFTLIALLFAGFQLAQEMVLKAPDNGSSPSVSLYPVSGQLDLSNQGLTAVPQSVFNEVSLTSLNVSYNDLTGALPAEIRHLQNLRVLNASHNRMTGVPAEIGQLQNLETLDLSYNQLTGLPLELGNLQHLRVLNLTGNNYARADLETIRKQLPASTQIIVN